MRLTEDFRINIKSVRLIRDDNQSSEFKSIRDKNENRYIE